MFYLLQAITVLYSIYLAYLNEVPVQKMIYAGASRSEEKKFHAANAVVKVIYSAAVSVSLYGFTAKAIICFFTIGFIQWFVFDIALNLFLKKTWDYLGDTAKIDKVLTHWFPHGSAGLKKAIFCFLVIIGLNVLNFFV
jgi:hypothetical protein